MPKKVVPILQQSSSRKKRAFKPVSYSKKLRSKIPRRKRIPIFPIVDGSSNELVEDTVTEISSFAAASCSSSCFPGEISSNSSLIQIRSENLGKRPRSTRQKKEKKQIGVSGTSFQTDVSEKSPGKDFRPMTRAYFRQKNYIRTKEDEGNADEESFSRSDLFSEGDSNLNERSSKRAKTEANQASIVELSEISCIESFFVEKERNLCKIGEFTEKNSNPSSRSRKVAKQAPDIEQKVTSGIGFSEISCIDSLSGANARNLCQSEGNFSVKGTKTESDVAESTAEKETNDLYSDLACSEKMTEEDSDHSTFPEMTLSELEAEISHKHSEQEFSDYTPSIFNESSDDFSERSAENSNPSTCFSMFLQYSQQLSRLSSRLKAFPPSETEEEYSDDFTLLSFEDEEHEESYKKFRSRERKHSFLVNYNEEYSSTSEFDDLIVQQRLLMVNWIIEHSNAHMLHCKTLFLGVSLLDRFLSRGFFKNQRYLQILGISCCTLTIRIEENQPLNSIMEMTFNVGNNIYSRRQVVAMEWLVMEVLNYQCSMPTTYNFLWFYLKAARADAEVENRAKYLAVLSLLDHERLCFWPSSVAAGLVILASLASNRDDSCQWVMETHVRTRNDDLSECIESLEWLVKYVC
ncbi:cyclin-SDS-like [Tasmannia lanceolata]|uniref:cyclin-SDS-like n=1 Tax=Tasmannia lanceolata TaxID=3420 RepID=UPI0040645FC7